MSDMDHLEFDGRVATVCTSDLSRALPATNLIGLGDRVRVSLVTRSVVRGRLLLADESC